MEEDFIDKYFPDFMNEIDGLRSSNDDPFSDCNLNREELAAFLTPPVEKWVDCPPEDEATRIKMDESKQVQWELAIKEIKHVRERLRILIHPELELSTSNLSNQEIILFCIGPESKCGKYLKEQLHMNTKEYLQFMHTFCLQAAYKISSTQLYANNSLLKDKTQMTREKYNKFWKAMSEKKKLRRNSVTTSRRDPPLWEELEKIVNELLRSISIIDRKGKISISLDDDKVWLRLSNSSSDDTFNLRYTTHVRANRKGIIAHTAVSTGVMMPLGIAFEKMKDSSGICVKRILNFLFNYGGETNLRNVIVHSDRGYLVPEIVFLFLLACGAQVLGTTKRLAKCWPFTYSQKVGESDKRTLLSEKGAPTLFLKCCGDGVKKLYASAFRNGTGKIATAISSIHTEHEWEGIILDPSELVIYKEDDEGLISHFFKRVLFDDDMNVDETDEEREMLDYLLDNVIEPITLRQGE